ncbi:MAG: hypothetical protein LBV72_00370 [Tannerella sp.]|jgi:hypothetical protein|nr:hypothetical protein [Tannerella sp.]
MDGRWLRGFLVLIYGRDMGDKKDTRLFFCLIVLLVYIGILAIYFALTKRIFGDAEGENDDLIKYTLLAITCVYAFVCFLIERKIKSKIDIGKFAEKASLYLESIMFKKNPISVISIIAAICFYVYLLYSNNGSAIWMILMTPIIIFFSYGFCFFAIVISYQSFRIILFLIRGCIGLSKKTINGMIVAVKSIRLLIIEYRRPIIIGFLIFLCSVGIGIYAWNDISDTDVYICTGNKSASYHKSARCKGLQRCSGDVFKVDKDDSECYWRKPCGYCYK